ncbi:hypothetical protein [uncultured Kordia sp.]|uniref:hypothetical protein n=1 Tax=uncultured Kordia sp. TaxID=507699 RepID=UPI002616DF67|nr:hypothetical protein [uncultured Kordia sp.]
MQIDFIGNTQFNKKTINYLSVLKPAATAILLAPTKTELKDVIRYTLLDLTLQKVLFLEQKFIKYNPNDAYAREVIIVETSKNFTNYYSSEYEKCFLSIINEENYFRLYLYLRKIYYDAPLDSVMKRAIIKESNIENLFLDNIFLRTFNTFRLNANGKKVRNELKQYIATIDKNIATIIQESPEQALQLLSFLKGNVFLLKNLTNELLEQINLLIKERTKNAYFEMFDIFHFSEIFFTPISEEITELLNTIEKQYNAPKTSSETNEDTIDYFF